MKMSEIEGQIKSLKKQESDKITEVRELVNNEHSDVADVQAGMKEVEELRSQLVDAQQNLKTVQRAKELSDDETKAEEKKESKDMKINPNQEQETAEVRDFISYLKTGEKRDNGMTTVDAGVVIPKEILDVQKVPTDNRNLASLVNRVLVSSGMGTLPILQKNTAR